jgi:branched-chain amino acid transport system ATP-binding protein
MDSLLKLDNCTIRFGGLTAVSSFSMEITKGELVGLIGPNGAGKTTVFNMVTGVYAPESG